MVGDKPWNRFTSWKKAIMEGVKPTAYFIIHYEGLRKADTQEILNLMDFDLVCFDEAHKLRNANTQQFKGAETLEVKQGKVFISGSPVVNSPLDVYALLALSEPGVWTRNSFLAMYTFGSQGQWGYKVHGVRNQASLRKEVHERSIRRTKSEVLSQLPPKVMQEVPLELSEAQRKVYERMEKDFFALLEDGTPLHSPNMMSQLMRLRQITTDPTILGVSSPSVKTDAVMGYMEETDKVVVFSIFKTFINVLAKEMEKAHISYVRLTGDESPQERAAAVDAFQTDPKIKACIGTMQVMGESITLTAASAVILVDRWWSPAVNDQAVDRLHRPGQHNSVQVISLVAQDTIDQYVEEVLSTKRGFASELDVAREAIMRRREALKEKK